MKRKKLSAGFLLILIFAFYNQAAFARLPQITSATGSSLVYSENFWRTELYFGTDKPDGSVVTDEEWNGFLSEQVTPKFPDGFTVLESYGQFRDASGKIVKEKSRCLVLLYSKKMRKDSDGKIEEIRTAFKKAFQQESVLRVDFRQTVRASF